VNTEHPQALVAVALDQRGVASAGGCVDLPAGVLLVDVPLRVVIPMHLFRVAPEGSYDVVSRLPLGSVLKAAPLVTAAWRELAACPQDPQRLWLDCTLDALFTHDGDPSDCHPGDDEGPLGAKLAARRGTLTMNGMACRDETSAGARASLDLLVGRLFGARSALLTGLPQLSGELARVLEMLELRSTLDVSRTSDPSRYLIDHRLLSATFPMARPEAVSLDGLGAPGLLARFVPAMAMQTDLVVGTHGFTLRLGTAARLAFARGSMLPRGAPADTAGFLVTLFSAATLDDHGTTLSGCAALDALVCDDVTEPRGCLLAACTAGLGALAHNLDAGFAALDGDGVDLVLWGTVPVVDTNRDGLADALGALANEPGIWSGEVRGRGGPSTLAGTWTATRAFR
jgi:hypothetical protein